MKLAIGLPAFNEENNLAKIIVKLEKIADRIIVCNDGSTDATGLIAERLDTIVINHSKNLGYGASIKSIFKKAKEENFDVLVTFDADGQHTISDIEKVIKPIKDGKADLVIGSRFLEENKNIPNYRKVGIKVITKVSNFSIKNDISDSQSGFRAYNKKALELINASDSGMGISTEILIKASKNNLSIAEVPINVSYEGDTSTHNPIFHGTSVLLSTIKFMSIENPLKFYGIPGIIFLVIGLFFIIWTIDIFSETRQIVTNISLIGIGAIILGIIMLMNAIILYSLVSVVREQQSN